MISQLSIPLLLRPDSGRHSLIYFVSLLFKFSGD